MSSSPSPPIPPLSTPPPPADVWARLTSLASGEQAKRDGRVSSSPSSSSLKSKDPSFLSGANEGDKPSTALQGSPVSSSPPPVPDDVPTTTTIAADVAVDDAAPVIKRWRKYARRRFVVSWSHVQHFRSAAQLRDEYSMFLTSPEKVAVRRGVDALEIDILHMMEVNQAHEGRVCFAEVSKAFESLLVAMLGHYMPRPRRRAVQLLNCLYTGRDWELAGPLDAIITRAGEPFAIDTYVLAKSRAPEFLILVSAPPAGSEAAVSATSSFASLFGASHGSSAGFPAGGEESSAGPPSTSSALSGSMRGSTFPSRSYPVLTAHVPTVKALGSAGGDGDAVVYHLTLKLADFPRTGFYDWRAVVVNSSGETAAAEYCPPSRLHPSLLRSVRSAPQAHPGSLSGTDGAPCQGRFVVQPAKVLAQQMKEVVVDLQNMSFDERTGDIHRHGTFEDVAATVAAMKDSGVTSLFVVGAFERDNGWGDGDAALKLEEAAERAIRGKQEVDSSGDESDGSGFYSDGEASLAKGFTDVATLPAPEHTDRRLVITSTEAVESWEERLRANSGVRALSTRPDANLHAVVSRTIPNRMLGGESGFRKLLAAASDAGISLAVHVDGCVSATRSHRKYSKLHANILNQNGIKAVHPGTDSCANQFEDQALLNYRKLETWNTLIQEVAFLHTDLGVSSVYLSDAQSYPFIMSLDVDELFRFDADGDPAYTPIEILEGEVVLPNAELGFWGTRLSRSYPNPLLIKLMRTMWEISPEFVVYGESHWGRGPCLSRSGIIPHEPGFLDAIASTLERSVDKMGFVTHSPRSGGQAPVERLRQRLQTTVRSYPPGGLTMQVRALSSARLPYPALILGRTAWTAVDLLYCLPGVPMTFQDEVSGKAYRVDVTHTYVNNTNFLSQQSQQQYEVDGRRSLLQRPHVGASHRRRARQLTSRAQALVSPISNLGARSVSDPNLQRLMQRGLEASLTGTGSIVPPDGAAQLKGVESVADYQGHVGVGGVVAASTPPLKPMATLPGQDRGRIPLLSGGPGGSAVVAAGSAAAPELARGGHTDAAEDLSRTGGMFSSLAGGGGMANVMSSPALYQMLTGGVVSPTSRRSRFDSGDNDDDPGTGVGLDLFAPSPSHDAQGLFEHGESFLSSDEDDDALEMVAAERAGVAVHPAGDAVDMGWHSRGHAAPLSKKSATTRPHGGGQGARPGPLSKAVGGNAAAAGNDTPMASELLMVGERKIRSWHAVEGMRITDGNDNSLTDGVKNMRSMESRLRAEVGPQFGFDLNLIYSHYNHRQELRRRFPVLQHGDLVILKANHRFGEHGHVFAFARVYKGDVAVIACNFNHHPSTFSVDCTALTQAFGASDPEDVEAPYAFDDTDPDLRNPKPNFAAIYEVRDLFQSEFRHADELGPLIGFFTSDEAAHASVPTTLQPHRSMCWLYRRTSSGNAVAVSSDGAGGAGGAGGDKSEDGEDAASSETSTAPSAADLQWVLSSSIARLAASLSLKTGSDGLGHMLATMAAGRRPTVTSGAGGTDEGKRTRRWVPPSDVLRDSEIRRNIRHNLVYASLYGPVHAISSKRDSSPGSGSGSGSGSASGFGAGSPAPLPSAEERQETLARLLSGSLCALVRFLRMKAADGDTLTAEPLPVLSGNAGGGGDERSSHGWSGDAVADIVGCVRASLFFAAQALDVKPAEVLKALLTIAQSHYPAPRDPNAEVITAVRVLAKRVLVNNNIGPIVFLTPELGKWSTVGGLGVMVDELTVGLASLGADVTVISPFYHVNRKGRGDYLSPDGIVYTGKTIAVWVGDERLEMGVHEGRVKGVRLLFLHHSEVFPRPYPPHNAYSQLRVISAFNKAALETLCQLRVIPTIVVTNDWFTGLAPAFARHGHFGTVFDSTDFMHIAHNLDPSYEGRLYPERYQGALEHLHGLPSNVLVDPHWADTVINPTRAALMCSDTWATVSCSYREDLLNGSPMRPLLANAPQPFAHPNGIPVEARKERLAALPTKNHAEAKAALQRKYFGMEHPDPSIPLFAFVGRITLQKGVHLILNSVDDLLRDLGGHAQFLVGGMASSSDTYGAACARSMRELAGRHRGRFWADPTAFFTDGDMVNLGADFCMMPSMFEPGGIVQQEFYVAGTPVIAFKTGGLKDTVIEFDYTTRKGTGFTFEAHTKEDYMMAVKRAVNIFHNHDMYQQLRSNASNSVMDLSVVALNWFKEFYRLRRCLAVVDEGGEEGVTVVFRFPIGESGCKPSSRVQVTGSFLDWASPGREMTYQPPILSSPMRDHTGNPAGDTTALSSALARDYPGGWFETSVSLPIGSHKFKFVVDGSWVTCSRYGRHQAGAEPENNVIQVQPSLMKLPDWM